MRKKKTTEKTRVHKKKPRGGHLARPKCLRCVKKQNKQKNASAQKTNKQINVGAPLGAPHAPLARHAAKPRKPGSSKISDVTFVKIEVLPISKGLFRYFDKESRKTCLKWSCKVGNECICADDIPNSRRTFTFCHVLPTGSYRRVGLFTVNDREQPWSTVNDRERW